MQIPAFAAQLVYILYVYRVYIVYIQRIYSVYIQCIYIFMRDMKRKEYMKTLKKGAVRGGDAIAGPRAGTQVGP